MLVLLILVLKNKLEIQLNQLILQLEMMMEIVTLLIWESLKLQKIFIKTIFVQCTFQIKRKYFLRMDVDYAPTGKEFVSGSYDKTIRIFPVD